MIGGGKSMMQYIGKILPMDGYKVIVHGQLPIDYTVSLTHLYQPLIGIDGIMLYQTLLNEAYVQHAGELQTHHTLMNYLQQPLDVIYEARLKLEGIGLLQTHKDVVDQRTYYTYEVQSPFSPQYFLQDAMLSELLYHHIGKSKFDFLKETLHKEDECTGENITASFKDVFETFQPTFEVSDATETKSSFVPVQQSYSAIDEQSIRHALARKMIRPEHILTEKNKQLIAQMMDIYQLEMVEVGRCLTWSITEDHYLDEEEFKQTCEELFKTKNHTAKIKLTPKQQSNQQKQRMTKEDTPKQLNKQESNPQPTRREIILREFEMMSPAQLLADYSPNGNVSKRDLDLVQDVMRNQGLATPVMNVLIHYVFMQQNKQLSKNYLETIASHWARVGFTTAEEAMKFAQSVNDRYKKAKQQVHTKKKQNQKEIIPDWYDEHMKQIEEVERTKEAKRKEQNEDLNEGDIERELDELIRSVSKK